MSQAQKLPTARAGRSRGPVVATDGEADLPGARERILAAAQELFYAQGYSATSVASIADAAQMTTPNLYWHFPSKQALLGEVLERAHRSFLDDLLRAIPSAGPAQELLAAYVRQYVRLQLSLAQDTVVYGYWILAADLSPEDAPRLLESRREIHRVLRGIVTRGIDEGVFHLEDASLAVNAIETSCEYVFTWYKSDGRLSVDDVLDGFVEIALRIVGYRAA